jgi:hypothetical protein
MKTHPRRPLSQRGASRAKMSIASRAAPPGARSPPPGYVATTANAYGITLDDHSVRWAAAERGLGVVKHPQANRPKGKG